MPRKKPSPSLGLRNQTRLVKLLVPGCDFRIHIQKAQEFYRVLLNRSNFIHLNIIVRASGKRRKLLGGGSKRLLWEERKRFLTALKKHRGGLDEFTKFINAMLQGFNLEKEWAISIVDMVVSNFWDAPPDNEESRRKVKNVSTRFFENAALHHRIHGNKFVVGDEKFEDFKSDYLKRVYKTRPIHEAREIARRYLQGSSEKIPIPKKRRSTSEAVQQAYLKATPMEIRKLRQRERKFLQRLKKD